MQEITANIWNYHIPDWVVITTNNTVKKNGEAVMGRGVALQAAQFFPALPYQLGRQIEKGGKSLHFFPEFRIVAFPVKHEWFEKADIQLIERSAKNLAEACEKQIIVGKVSLPRPGCGNGGLHWKDVKPVIERYLSGEQFTVVEIKKEENGI